MKETNLELGKRGEEAAVKFLRDNGYKILERNYKNKLGEIDVIAKDNQTLCFVEVKSRSDLRFGYPKEAITFFKQRQLNKVALCYLKQYNLLHIPARFDVVSVVFGNQDKTDIELIKDAFSLLDKYN